MTDPPPTAMPPGPTSELDLDLGFGSVVARESRRRLLNRDGSFNVVRHGLGPIESLSPYHALLNASWTRLLASLAVGYLLVNALFALGYVLCGPDALYDSGGMTPGSQFARAFFFSVETFATIGYGTIAPVGWGAHLLMVAESLVGLLAAALAAGVIFARFARPTARVRFSRTAIVAPYQAGSAFMFRLANERASELVELQATVLFSRMEDDGRGGRVRRFADLRLERQRVTFFPLAWTVVHPIDDHSPLRGLGPDDLAASEAEFLVLLSGLDETFAQTVHARTSYKPEEIVWNARFSTVFDPPAADGQVSIDIRRLNEFETL